MTLTATGDLSKLGHCIWERYRQVGITPEIPVPREPDPLRERERARIYEARMRAVIDAVAGEHPDVARDLSQLADLRYGSMR